MSVEQQTRFCVSLNMDVRGLPAACMSAPWTYKETPLSACLASHVCISSSSQDSLAAAEIKS